MTTLDTPDIDLSAAGWVYKAFEPLDDSGLTPLPASLLPDSIHGLVAATLSRRMCGGGLLPRLDRIVATRTARGGRGVQPLPP